MTLACWFTLTLSGLSLKVKVMSEVKVRRHGSCTQEETRAQQLLAWLTTAHQDTKRAKSRLEFKTVNNSSCVFFSWTKVLLKW